MRISSMLLIGKNLRKLRKVKKYLLRRCHQIAV